MTSDLNELRSVAGNRKMQNVMTGVLQTLHRGGTLSDAQSSALIENIRRRVPGHGDFTWNDPISLTKEQIRHARRTGRSPDDFTPAGQLEQDADAEYHTNYTPISHLDPTDFTPVPHRFHTAFTPEEPATPSGVSDCGPLTERNDTERNVTSGSDHSLAARGPDQKFEMIASGGIPPENNELEMIEAIMSQTGFARTSSPEEIQRDKTLGVSFNPACDRTEEERLAAQASALQGLVELGDPAVSDLGSGRPSGPLQASVALGTGGTLDIWYDGVSTCLGELQFNGARYWLRFTGIYPATDRLAKERAEPGDWTFNEMIWNNVLVPERGVAIATDSPKYRFKASPVFKSRDRKGSVFAQLFVVLGWRDGAPNKALIVNGPDTYEVQLHSNNSKNTNAPTSKGKLREV
uniref:hypothetical protein n=1 Tax=uncultured Caulobacter sp. TaxID=158749 RepID=UPI0025E21EAE|nr:hypothetical protein [uncultured Caulobacter sp.]